MVVVEVVVVVLLLVVVVEVLVVLMLVLVVEFLVEGASAIAMAFISCIAFISLSMAAKRVVSKFCKDGNALKCFANMGRQTALSMHACMQTDRQTDRQIDKQTGRQTDCMLDGW